MRMSDLFLPTEREPPADAEAVSHKLMVRAGLIRQVGSGLWSWLPAGWRVHRKAEQIIREEIDAIGGQEMLMPVLLPAEYWKRSGRYESVGAELFRLRDRREAEMVLAMTHEEIVTFHASSGIRSWRDLPKILYHIQTKERDEPRPRAGVLRTREFIMKDSYTFDRDADGLDAGYAKHIEAYDRIFDRAGLEWYRVLSDVGMMGGTDAHEYMAPSAAGENEVALAPGYAANVEIASAEAQPVELPADWSSLNAPAIDQTPGLTTVAEVAGALGVPAGALLKAYPIVLDDTGAMRMVVVRGDHQVNDVKLRHALGATFRPAHPDEITERIGPPGFIGPVGTRVSVLLDAAIDPDRSYVAGANEPDRHLHGVRPARDFAFDVADVRRVEAGDRVGGNEIRLEPAIEIGNIFKLGTRYSEPFGATYVDESGNEQLIWMGSYGIGPARITAAAVEQYADEAGISWPRALAPWDVELVGLGKPGTPEHDLAERLYRELQAADLAVLYDDRDAGPGEKFTVAELLGCPLRVTVGRRTIENGAVELQIRRGRDSESVPLEGAAAAVAGRWASLV
jgi:prolyl-tRNA synthetase